MPWPLKSSSVVSCRHSTTGCSAMRWALACQCGLRMSCQSMSSCAKKRKAPRVSPQPPQAAGMLGVGCRLKVSASFTCRRFRRLSPRSRSANSSCAQLIRSIFSSKNQQLTAESSRCVQSDGHTGMAFALKKFLSGTLDNGDPIRRRTCAFAKSSVEVRRGSCNPAASHSLQANSSAQLGDARLRIGNEACDLVEIRVARILLRQSLRGNLKRCGRLEQFAHRVFDPAYALGIEAFTLQSDGIDDTEHRWIAFRNHKGEDVFGDLVGGANERIFSQAHELDDTGHAIDRRVVVDLDVPGELRTAPQHDMTADAAVMPHVTVRQESAIVGYPRRRSVVGR